MRAPNDLRTETALERLKLAGVYVLFDPRTRRRWADDLHALAQAGVPWFQLRAKGAAAADIRDWLVAARVALGAAPVLIVNDDPALAAAADGVHLGPGDATAAEARRALGPAAVVGVSGDDAGRLTGGAAAGVSYFGIGAYRATASKPDAGLPLGAVGLERSVVMACGVPAVAIGGLSPGDAAAVRSAGAIGMAVLSGVWGAADPVTAARSFLDAWSATA